MLDSSGEAQFYYGPSMYGLTLTDAQDVPLWTVDPVNAGTGGGAASAGMGMGSNTVELRPGASTAQAAAVVFPASVLAMGLTVWVSETFGASQGLTQIGIGAVEHPDCWGVLTELTADTQTQAGVFLTYGGQPIPADGTVTLTAYGGSFDGTGAVYLTGHFATFAPSHALGLTWTPPGPPSPSPPDPQPYATEMTPGVVELVDTTEVLQDTDLTRALTIGRLVSRTATETRSGLVELNTPAETVTGTDTTRATHPAGVKAALDARVTPTGTPLSVARYAASGQQVEPGSAVVVIDAAGHLGVGTATPEPTYGTTLTAPENVAPAIVVATSATTSNQTQAFVLLRRTSGDMVDRFGLSLAFQIADATSGDQLIGQVLFRREGADNSGRFLVKVANAGVLAGNTAPGDLAVDPVGNLSLNADVLAHGGTRVLALGQGTAPTSGPIDAVQLWSANRGGVAGKNSLHLRAEDGTSHVLGDLSGLGTTLTATLGVGSYQALTVKGSLLTVGQSSVQERAQALIASSFVVSTDATRTARLALSVYDATSAREGLRIETSGTAPLIGFLGAAAVARQALAVAATDAATTQTLANSLRTALINLGLGV